MDAIAEGGAVVEARAKIARSGSRELAVKKRPSQASKIGGVGLAVKRMSISLSDRGLRRLEDLKGDTDAVSAADVIRNALRVYDFLVSSVKEGKTIAVVSETNPSENTKI